MTEPLIDQVCRIVADAIAHRYWLRPKPTVERDSDLAELGADSLDRITIQMAYEEIFDIDICTDEVARWNTVADVLASVQGKVTAGVQKEKVA